MYLFLSDELFTSILGYLTSNQCAELEVYEYKFSYQYKPEFFLKLKMKGTKTQERLHNQFMLCELNGKSKFLFDRLNPIKWKLVVSS